MRISDWSSDVCSSDLPPRRTVSRLPGTGALHAATRARFGRLHLLSARGRAPHRRDRPRLGRGERQGHRLFGHGPAEQRSEEHTSELQSLMRISSAVFCLTTNINLFFIFSLYSFFFLF